ncbi:MAG TPA: penicillin-binding transpeptidase domain-containing protein [Bryobacteraceae bacterium]|nr:penicillin-binding transpeptidase domain-containing protein [Bryobacteraceae bacterium]
MYQRLLITFLSLSLFLGSAFGDATTATRKKKKRRHTTTATSAVVVRHARRHVVSSPWKTPTYANSTDGDSVDGEDLVVRRAAVQALGPYNGAVVVVDPNTGRLLTTVNQKLAFQGSFEPCSTIKIVAALAGLSEGVIDGNDLARRRRMNLTEALAHSNNAYFANVGEKLGYDRIVQYASMLGLGQRAGLDIDGEQPGSIASEPPSDGLGMMTSFGEGFYMTPLELAAIVTAVANGGTLYYLQHPRSEEEVDLFQPSVKRQLNLSQWLPDIRPGMLGAVEYGTARRIGFSADDPIFGKTGTCTDSRSPTHLGWFGSYNEVGDRKLVVVVLLTGGYGVSGPVASGIAGNVYKNLAEENYFARVIRLSPAALIGVPAF